MSHLEPEYGEIGPGRHCTVCGYALVGLKHGGQCPECGAPITPVARNDDAISGMPETVIRTYRIGGLIASIAAICAVMTLIVRFAQPGFAIVYEAILAGLGVAWFVGSCWLTSGFETPASAGYGFSSRGRLRVVARRLQPSWTVYWLIAMVQSASPAGTAFAGYLESAMFLLTVTTCGGLMMMAVVLRRIAAWTRDDFAEGAFNVTVFLLPVVLVLPGSVGRGGIGLFFWFGIVALQTTILFALPAGLLSLTRSLDYAVGHAQDAEVRDDNRQERQQRSDRRMHRRLESVEMPERGAKDGGRTR